MFFPGNLPWKGSESQYSQRTVWLSHHKDGVWQKKLQHLLLRGWLNNYVTTAVLYPKQSNIFQLMVQAPWDLAIWHIWDCFLLGFFKNLNIYPLFASRRTQVIQRGREPTSCQIWNFSILFRITYLLLFLTNPNWYPVLRNQKQQIITLYKNFWCDKWHLLKCLFLHLGSLSLALFLTIEWLGSRLWNLIMPKFKLRFLFFFPP